MPSYCCESMILPFIRSKIDVAFYPVYQDEMEIPQDHDADIICLIDYFGYCLEQNYSIAVREKQKGKIIIYDATHKIDGNPEVEAHVDYSFCSYRKWLYCNYAKAICHNGFFDITDKLALNESYIQLRDEAARKKKRFIDGLTKEKNSYLSDFNLAEELLESDYEGYSGLPIAFDLQKLIFQRRENAEYLISALRDVPNLKLWRTELKQKDVPMFVPILMESQIRDKLRRYLIDQQIFCPIHWPKSLYHTMHNDLYDMELSLICDQRYNLSDMDRMVSAIKGFIS